MAKVGETKSPCNGYTLYSPSHWHHLYSPRLPLTTLTHLVKSQKMTVKITSKTSLKIIKITTNKQTNNKRETNKMCFKIFS